ncbi:LacI family DNA-binding transcriptional regulator [Hoeflea prorocentri]|uniref:LacI family DNA-binding transcriptional regulator n=1 Tax=Hoeflea prorocentri TaxID=1922333 RepID=A0A9X3UMI8_9HYPH|nr:LacI family DNA-binding transcriptional regulator [Hoeflea prorocentri]MCY6381934.1 LacI family DNA-binding transcriptional regulator [Hoeflea prorocentri]MDA5399734.1 LacI family DNA-binding transcriptional regulator [Hoeflea prorocentri]
MTDRTGCAITFQAEAAGWIGYRVSYVATIKDIADKVGVSPTTVSRVLNADPTLSVSKKVRVEVTETAAELNYEVRGTKRKTFGNGETVYPHLDDVIILQGLSDEQELEDPYYVGLRLGIERACRSAGLPVRIVYANESNGFNPGSRTGIAVVGHHDMSSLQAVLNRRTNVVFVGTEYEKYDRDVVYHDLSNSMRKLLSGLTKAGYRNFGFIGGRYDADEPEAIETGERLSSFRDWLTAEGLYDKSLVRQEGKTPQNGYQLTRDLIDQDRQPDVIVAATDSLAIGAYMALKDAGKQIGGDIAVVAFNDIPAARHLVPPLTTVKLPAELIGKTAFELLQEQAEGRVTTKRVILGSDIVWRESCRTPENTDDVF